MAPPAKSIASSTAGSPSSRTVELEQVVQHVEQGLVSLADALRERDGAAIEHEAGELHRALANAVQCFMHVAEHGGVPEPLRRRLARASATVARQRESLARATAALDRAIDVLMPAPHVSAGLYASNGLQSSSTRGGMLRA
ncbi:hypothetical protein [Ideonella sp. A 288]|uniref:hypothetical protein n=1 Tax=Ideonella sp. A 288 TaxID=1962181 RepID=UPI001F23C2CD|nr:hypothetical protein [Ideonella sp. A 288]